jgi:hypothetical protein
MISRSSSVVSVSPWCIGKAIVERRIILPAFRIWVTAFAGTFFVALSAQAQTVSGDTFADASNGAKMHVASKFLCPAKIGPFERDAVGEADPETGADFCAYAALDGVYGTIRLVPLHGVYDAKESLAKDFAEQEGSGGKSMGEKDIALEGSSGGAPISVFTRTYETAKLEDLHYRVQFAGAAIGNWAVETTIEFAEPRDLDEAQNFLRAVFVSARGEIAAAP